MQDRTAAGKDCVSCRSSMLHRSQNQQRRMYSTRANDKRSEVKLKAKGTFLMKTIHFKLFIITLDFVKKTKNRI